MFYAEGSCRHSFAARPFRLHPPGCLLVVRNILIYAFRVSAFCLPSACEIRVSGAQKISTVARVKARYVACSKHVFSHRKCLMLKEAAGWVFRSPSISATSSWVPSGRSKYFDICFPRFCILSTFRMRDQSFWCSKDIYGGQSKSALRRLQQACFLP